MLLHITKECAVGNFQQNSIFVKIELHKLISDIKNFKN